MPWNQDPETLSNKDEDLYSKCIKWLGFSMILLSILRLITLDIMGTISDGLGVLMIYFFFISRTKCMAIFLLFNAAMGAIVSYNKITQLKMIAAMMDQYDSNLQFQMFVVVYGLIVYLFEVIISGIGIYKYPWDAFFGLQQNYNQQYQASNDRNNGYGTVYNPANPSSSNNNQGNFVPFQGRGTTLA